MVKCLHQIHSLFGIDRAINGGVSQSVLLEVQCYHLQHAGPLRDNDTREERTKTIKDYIVSSAGCNTPSFKISFKMHTRRICYLKDKVTLCLGQCLPKASCKSLALGWQ